MDCSIKEGFFANTNLYEASFQGSDLSGATFEHCDLRKCNFVDAKNYTISPIINKLEDAKFSLPEALGLLQGLGIKLTDPQPQKTTPDTP